MILPIYASLERMPASFLEASGDLGAKAGMTFRNVVVADGDPGGRRRVDLRVLADPRRLHRRRRSSATRTFIGNVIYDSVGVANNLPLAAAFALVPVAIMAIYLALAKRLGAFEAL